MGAFQWLGAHPENLQHLGMWMTVQRYGAESWLDNFPFEKTVTEGVSDESRLLFVDVGGGVGHQCQVGCHWTVPSHTLANSLLHRH
jgi:hypothetical protein